MKTTDEGIMKLPDKGNVDFGEMIIREDLFKKGIDPKTITSETQLDGILNTPNVAPKPKKTGEVIDVDFGNFPEKKAGGGRTGTGLNYLLGEDDQNVRVPYAEGSSWDQFQKEKLMQKWQEYQQYLKNREKEKRQKPYIEERLGVGPGPVLEAAEGGRIGLKDGTKFDPKRRTILKGIGALAALPIVGKFFKWAKPAAKIADVTSVPIKAGVDGMPAWFKPLVNRVIKEGDDVTKQFATREREIVHQVSLEGKLGKDAVGVDDVRVTQNLDEGTIRVEYNTVDSPGEYGVDLIYKQGEDIEPILAQHMDPKNPKGPWLSNKAQKTQPEFTAVEAEPRVMNYDGDIEWDGENVVSAVDDLLTDTTKLEAYATGKKPNIKKLLKSEKKQKKVNKLNEDQVEQAEYIEQKYGPGPDPTDFDDWVEKPDFASGGRVPLGKGKIVKGLASLLQKKFPGTTKLGQTSRPMAPKTELKQAIAGFEKRNAPKIWEDETKVREAVDDIFSTGDYKYDAEMAAEALVENNPKAFGGKLIDDIDDATRMEIYGAVLRVVQSDLAKMLQLKRLSRPKKTLEGIEKTGTINISDEGVADEFTRFMKETDPKGHKKIEEIVEITNFDPKGKKGHASGGLAGMLGE